MGQFELLINTGRKGNKEHSGDVIRSPLLQKHFTTGLFLIKRKVTRCTQDDATQDLRDAVGTAHRQAHSGSQSSAARPLYLHSQRHLADSDLACFPCSWRGHFKPPQREVTTISNFTYKQRSPWKSSAVCCTAQRSSVSSFSPLKD